MRLSWFPHVKNTQILSIFYIITKKEGHEEYGVHLQLTNHKVYIQLRSSNEA